MEEAQAQIRNGKGFKEKEPYMTQREIKFRGWLPSIKAMVYEDDDLKLGRTKPGFIMQYTGLHDKNGKEIYEGDVLEWKAYYVHKRWWKDLSDIQVIEEEVKRQKSDVHTERGVVEIQDGSFHLSSSGYPVHGNHVRNNEWSREKSGTHGDVLERKWDFRSHRQHLREP